MKPLHAGLEEYIRGFPFDKSRIAEKLGNTTSFYFETTNLVKHEFLLSTVTLLRLIIFQH